MPRSGRSFVATLALVLAASFAACVGATAVADDVADLAVVEIHPDKARYAPGELVTIAVTVENRSTVPASASLDLRITHLADEVRREQRDIAVPAGESRIELFSWTAPAPDFRGYAVTAKLPGAVAAGSAVDVSSTPIRFPRYGYVARFDEAQQAQTAAGIRDLAQKFHVNLFQFYDWFWRHEQLVRREDGIIADRWLDIFGNSNSWSAVKNLVDEVHAHNGTALSYVMSYAAREGYEQLWSIPPQWGLYSAGDPARQLRVEFNFGSGPTLFLFDPGNAGWQDWIVSQYIDAIDSAGFDGVHIDQFGPRYGVQDAGGMELDLPARFVSFLDTVKTRLVEHRADKSLCTFNLVDGEVEGWAVNEVATSSHCDFLFSELWYETSTYDDILDYVEYARRAGGGRAVVLAGYSNYAEDIGPVHEAETAAQLAGVAVNDDHPGYTGSGFVDGFNEVGDSISWQVPGPVDLSYVTFVVRYANATDAIATRNLYIDDRLVGQMRFVNHSQWSTWGTDAWVQTLVGPGDHTVRLAYDDGNVGALNVDHLRLGEFDEDSVRLENAVMFASGASHIQLGDDIQSLAHEYYPNRSKSLTTSLREALRRYYDFATAYENLLFDPALELLGDGEAEVVMLTGQPLEPSPLGRIFTVERRTPRYHILHLVNLLGIDNEYWRDSAPFPIFQRELRLRYYTADAARVSAVHSASPDLPGGEALSLEFAAGADERGAYVEFTVPTLAYWDMIFMTRDP